MDPALSRFTTHFQVGTLDITNKFEVFDRKISRQDSVSQPKEKVFVLKGKSHF